MNIYSISYDLRQPNRDYSDLYEAIKSFKYWIHPLESNWFIMSEFGAQEIYNRLRPSIDNNDLLLIIKVDEHDKQGWMVKRFWDWLRN
jgi:hypothetical protein